jgi:hypothetical protein
MPMNRRPTTLDGGALYFEYPSASSYRERFKKIGCRHVERSGL